MNAGFIKRAMSSIIDLIIVFSFIAMTFFLFGRTIIRNQITDFDEIFAAYNEVVEAYNSDLEIITTEYTAALKIADGDEAKEALAQEAYATKKAMLDAQNVADIEPFNKPLTGYFLNCIYYFSIGFLILMAVYTLATGSKTFGRRVMQVKLSGPVNPISIFFHDIVFKYFFTVLVFSVSMYAGAVLLLVSLAIDLILLSFTKNKSTLRDLFLKMTVVKTGYGY
jgi:hypothetical protein